MLDELFLVENRSINELRHDFRCGFDLSCTPSFVRGFSGVGWGLGVGGDKSA
jgi:hypothetical protein